MVKLADGLAQTTAASWQHEDTETLTALLSEFLDLSHGPGDGLAAPSRPPRLHAQLQQIDYPLPGFELHIHTARSRRA